MQCKESRDEMFCAQVFAKSSAGVSFCPWKAGQGAKSDHLHEVFLRWPKGHCKCPEDTGVAKRFQATIMRCNRCSLLGWKGLKKKRPFSKGIIQGLETAHRLCCSLQWVEVPFKALMKSMILKFRQHLLWEGRGPSGSANARFNSRCSCVSALCRQQKHPTPAPGHHGTCKGLGWVQATFESKNLIESQGLSKAQLPDVISQWKGSFAALVGKNKTSFSSRWLKAADWQPIWTLLVSPDWTASTIRDWSQKPWTRILPIVVA